MRWRLKSPASWLFIQLFIHAQIIGNIKAPHSLAFVRGTHRRPVNSPHKGPVTRKCFHLMTSLCARWWSGGNLLLKHLQAAWWRRPFVACQGRLNVMRIISFHPVSVFILDGILVMSSTPLSFSKGWSPATSDATLTTEMIQNANTYFRFFKYLQQSKRRYTQVYNCCIFLIIQYIRVRYKD